MEHDEAREFDQADTLSPSFTPEQMRRLGYRVVDLVVDHLAGRGGSAAAHWAPAGDLIAELGGPVPRAGSDADAALDRMVRALAYKQHLDHPRYFARVPGPSSYAAILGDWLATGFNATATSWATAPGPSAIEYVVLDWLRSLLGLPEGTDSVMVSGGATANLTALAAARGVAGPGVAYLSDQTHSVLPRGLRLLGVPAEDVRILASDEELRFDLPALAAAVAADRAAGRRPWLVAATAGTTNTGAIDPLDELADFCAAQGLWLHVDGAYGGPVALTDEGRAAMSGLARADSLVLDPHKWLFQPVDAGCVFIRRPGTLLETFSVDPEYLTDVTARSGLGDYRNRSPEMTRRARAVKLWLTFTVYGLERIRAAISTCLDLARYAEARLRESEHWDLVTPAQCGIVTFALRGADAAEHQARAAALAADGRAAVTTTTLRGRSVLRLCLINPLTTCEDVDSTLRALGAPSNTPQD
jgi:glutamate/tyrosine decarboxylase-like PLP-dependent enzyme